MGYYVLNCPPPDYWMFVLHCERSVYVSVGTRIFIVRYSVGELIKKLYHYPVDMELENGTPYITTIEEYKHPIRGWEMLAEQSDTEVASPLQITKKSCLVQTVSNA